jgi:hypothetical protein
LNGKGIDVRQYKFYDGPFIQSERGTGVITMTDGKQMRELNFKKATIKTWQLSKN